MKKSRRKIFFSGISESTQANFCWALIFWLLLYQDKSNKDKTLFDQVGAKQRSAGFFGGSERSEDPDLSGQKGHKNKIII